MSDTLGSMIGHAAAVACLTLLAVPPVAAQTSETPAPSPGFLTQYDFHLTGYALAIDDARFSWDTHFGGEVDLVDYGFGRASIAADYEAVLGDEFRVFDPNQSYYALEASSSYRAGRTEIVGVFHHVSRHLSDRPKRFAIAWNVLEVRVKQQFGGEGLRVDVEAEAGKLVQHSWVDYSWTGDADVMIRKAVARRVGLFAHGYGELFGVEDTSPRGTQRGGRFEAGVRFDGRAGALELFAGVERRLDADPVERVPHRWGIAGFRLLGR